MGIDVDNPAELAAFANIGLTVAVWRNTTLEDLHSGWNDSDTQPDRRVPPTTDRAGVTARTMAIAAQVDAGAGIPTIRCCG